MKFKKYFAQTVLRRKAIYRIVENKIIDGKE
jgi:hypothetical protein